MDYWINMGFITEDEKLPRSENHLESQATNGG